MYRDNQEIFDIVAAHLLNQMEVSRRKDICWYRGPRGLKCAIGCLIPDDVYSDHMERHTVDSLFYAFPELEHVFDDPDMDFLRELQAIHDCRLPSHWLGELERVASHRGLNKEVLKHGTVSK